MPPAQPLLNRVSLTGVDDDTSLDALNGLSQEFPFVEWAILYVPHNEGVPRNPTRAWRQAFLEAKLPGYAAVHLCGNLAFVQLLQKHLPSELMLGHRLQLNVNARKREFTDTEVLEIYHRALDLGPDLILQYPPESSSVILDFMKKLGPLNQARVHVLLDDSRGRGMPPVTWQRPVELENVVCGYAGGLGPDTVARVLTQLETQGAAYWPDMESSIRTDTALDLQKVRRVLQIAQQFRT